MKTRPLLTFLAGTALSLVSFEASAQIVRSSSAATAGDAGLNAALTAFRNDLGGVLNPNVAGSFPSGRREINWDGVPDSFSAPNNLPANFFNVNSPRGVVFNTPGSGFQVSADTTPAVAGTAVEFGNIDPSYTHTFATFTPERLFTALGSNIVDVNFFIPGSTVPSLTRGFGSIFSDVDLANTTSLEFFNASNASLGTFFAPNVAGANETFSFLGVSFATPVVSRVRITNGNTALGAGLPDQNGNPRDAVVMDDFIYGEPVPEPSSALAAFGVMFAGLLSRGRRSRQAAAV